MNAKFFVGLVGLVAAVEWGSADAFAQGSSCATPVVILGEGSYPFNSTVAGSTNFGAGTGCNLLPQGIAHEVYWQWTAASDGDFDFVIADDGQDMHLALYQGTGCAAICVGRGVPHSSGVVSFSLFGATAGETYLVQVANSFGLPGSIPGTIGMLQVRRNVCDPLLGLEDALEDNDTCATAMVLGAGTYTDLATFASDPDYFRLQVPPLSRLEAQLIQGGFTTQMRVFDSACTRRPGAYSTVVFNNDSPLTQEYVIELVPAAGQACSDYRLSVGISEISCDSTFPVDDVLEDNDACPDALDLSPGYYSGLYTSFADADFYRVEIGPLQTARWEFLSPDSPPASFVYDENCVALPLNSRKEVINSSLEPRTIIIQVIPSGTTVCALYDMDLMVFDDPCVSLGPDVLDDVNQVRSPEHVVGEGDYQDLMVRGSDSYELCVGAGETGVVNLALASGDGVLNGRLECSFNSGGFDCLFLPTVYDQGSGSNVTLQYQNTSATAEAVILVVSYTLGASGMECATYDMSVSGLGGCDLFQIEETTEFCPPATAHSGGEFTRLNAFSRSVGFRDAVLTASQGPVGQFGYMLAGTQAVAGSVVGAGELCLGGMLGRYNVLSIALSDELNSIGRFDFQGRFVNLAGSAPSFNPAGFAFPYLTPWSATVMAGDTLYFQLWHRDLGGTSNLSNGVGVTF